MITNSTKVAALRALKYAIALVEKQVQADVLADYDNSGSDRWRTPFGTVTIAHPKPKVTVNDEQAFEKWVAQNHPDEIVQPPKPPPEVRSSFRTAVMGMLHDADGKVIYGATGEVVDWATVTTSKEPYVSIRGPEKDAAVERATALITGQLDVLTKGLTEIEP